MQATQVQNHVGPQQPVAHSAAYQQDPLYQRVQPVCQQILQVFLENQSDESIHAVTMHVIEFRFNDDTNISQYLSPLHPEAVLKGRALEALAYWIQVKAKELDAMVPMAQSGANFSQTQFQNCKRQLEQASFQTDAAGVLAEFLYTIVLQMLGVECSCLANALAGSLVGPEVHQETMALIKWPDMLLANLVRRLEDIEAKVSKVVMELYHESHFMGYEDSKSLLMQFFRFYTVQTGSGTLEVHDSPTDSAYRESAFRVHLIDSFGCLMQLLLHLEGMVSVINGPQVVLGVDFEGVKLCRHGELCLVQMTINDDPSVVYVLDIFTLGPRAFSLSTPNGMSFKHALENSAIRKVWFDPRNDVDALYHQFGIMPEGIFDLQLAEVADRRSRGLHVGFVQGLQRCLTACPQLEEEQQVFAERINVLGKRLFEPTCGGDYEIFRQRPLHPVILVYSAHDSRYMLLLYQMFMNSMNMEWVSRVLAGGDTRAKWCLNMEYIVPNSEAPDF